MTRIVTAFAVLASASFARADAGKLHAGKWQITRSSTIGGNGTIVYMGDTMTSNATMNVEIPDHGTQTMTMHGEGKRIGDCP